MFAFLRDFICIQSTLQYKALCKVIIMNKEQNLKELEQESVQELNRDGFNELNFGIIFLVFFNAMYLGIDDISSISPKLLTLVGLTISIFGVVYSIFLLLYYKVYRKKYVYPRIGYVKLREDHSFKEKLGGFAFLVLGIAEEITLIWMLSTGVVTIDWLYRWIPFLVGLNAWIFCFALKHKSGQNIYLLIGALMTISGFVIALAEFISAVMVPIVYFDGWGFAFIMIGIIKFARFIRNYPIIETPEGA